jgi:hypothetical protein
MDLEESFVESSCQVFLQALLLLMHRGPSLCCHSKVDKAHAAALKRMRVTTSQAPAKSGEATNPLLLKSGVAEVGEEDQDDVGGCKFAGYNIIGRDPTRRV